MSFFVSARSKILTLNVKMQIQSMKNYFKIFLLLLLLLTYSVSGFSQQIPTINLTMKDGLSSNYVLDIAQDKSGFIWFATRYGLNRFDGHKFTVYIKSSDQEFLNSNDINKIVADTLNNKVWIANRWAGVNVFDCETETFSSFLHDENDAGTLISNEIKDILVTSTGNVWIATSKGLDLYDPDNLRFIHYNKLTVAGFPSDGINALYEGTNGDLYLGHIHDGFTVFSPENKSFKNFKNVPHDKNSLPNNTVHSIFVDMDSRIWIATDEGLSLFDPFRKTFRNFRNMEGLHKSIKGTVFSVYQTHDERIWVGTLSDLCYFDAKDADEILSGKKDVNHMFIQDIYWGISNPTVFCVLEDSFKNVWIGSNGGGASFISSTSSFFHSWRIDKIPGVVNGLNDKEVLTICIDEDENIWMGTDGGGINVNKGGINCEFYSANSGEVSSNAYASSLKDSNNDLWFGSVHMGIDIFLSKEKRFVHYTPRNCNSIIFCLFEDNCRNVWIGTDAGLEIYNLVTNEKSYLNGENSELLANEVRAVSQDKSGNIWIGTLNKGIVIYDPNRKKIKHIDHPVILNNCRVNQIFRDSRNRMWVATSEGLILFPDDRFDNCRMFNTADGLACNLVCSIGEDSDGNIWLSTNWGISCFVESEKRFLNYDYRNGALLGSYMNNSVAKTQDGTIYFGSINGVCFFTPQNRPAYIILPPVIFTEFKVYGKNSYEDVVTSLPMINRKTSLNYNQDIFSVSFNVMDKSLQGKVEYAYLLEGLGDTWINIGEENQVIFRNIPYRNYKLHVRARYKNQQWQNSYSTLSIDVNPPLWLTWWAKLFYMLCILLIAFLIIKSYKKRLELHSSLSFEKEKVQRQRELNEERLNFYTNITHELKTPLTLILGPLEDLQADSRIQEEHAKKLSLIHKSTIRLLNLVTQILEFRKTESQNKRLCVGEGDIAEKIQEIGLKYKELNRNNNIVFDIIINTKKTQLYFDQEVISMIIDNLLSNAFKYTYEGSIKLSLQSVVADDVEYTEIEISDTGIGISEEDLSHIFERYYQAEKRKNASGFGIGLALVKNLVDLHEGVILVDSTPGVGSVFRIRLITNNFYPDAIHISVKQNEIDEERGNKPIVLVVEDESDIRDYIAEALMGVYDVIVSENGEQGLRTALASIPDIIVSDIMMPVKDGIELCREIKANVATSHIPVILLTAKDTLQDKTEGYCAGADSYITKPFSASLLKSRVANLLEARKKMALLISSNTSFKHSVIKDSLNRIDNEFIERIIKIVEDNLMDEKIDVPTIAQELSMSYSSLYRKIKALTGMSTGEFIRKLRISKAEQLLLSGKYNISEIAHQVGLNSVSYFRECFKEEYGMSPSEYMKKMKEGDEH